MWTDSYLLFENSCIYLANKYLNLEFNHYIQLVIKLTLFFPMFPFDPPENIRKSLVFWCFQGDQKGILGRKGLRIRYFVKRILTIMVSAKPINFEPNGFVIVIVNDSKQFTNGHLNKEIFNQSHKWKY